MARLRLDIVGWAILFTAVCAQRPGCCQESPRPAEGENLSRSARLPQDRQQEALLSVSRTYLQERRYAEASYTLQRLLDAAEDSFVAETAHRAFSGAKAAANRLLAAMPNEGRQTYERQSGELAERLLSAACQSGDDKLLLDVVVRYQNTRAGMSALRRLAAHHFDHGRFGLAAVALERLVDRQEREGTRDPVEIARWIVACLRSDQSARADELIRRYAPQFESQTMSIGAETLSVREWLTANSSRSEAGHRAAADIRADHPDRHPTGDTRLVSSESVWTYSSELDKQLGDFLHAAWIGLRENGVPSLPSHVPLVVDNVVVFRSTDALTALNLNTGRAIWEARSGRPLDVRFLSSPIRVDQSKSRLVRELQSDSAYRTISSDATRVFVVEKRHVEGMPNAIRFSRSRASRTLSTGSRQQTFNDLVAYDLESGEECWRIDNTVLSTSDPRYGASFLGAPLVHFETLYVVGRIGTEVRLFAMDRSTGHVDWWLTLAHAGPNPDDEFGRVEFTACRVIENNGLLVCPTASGVVVAVDLLTHTRVWGYRYAHDVQPQVFPLPQRDGENVAPMWWRGWREATLLSDGTRVIVASPESAHIHALDLRTGALLWRTRQLGGLLVSGIADDRVLVMERYGLRAIDVRSGSTLWSAEVGTPCGRGCVLQGEYVVPMQHGGVAAIRVADGHIRRTFPHGTEELGNLVPVGEGMISQTPERIRLLSWLRSAREEAERAVLNSPGDPQAIARKARLDGEAGDFREAADAFRQLLRYHDNAESRDALRESLLVELGEFPRRIGVILPELEALCESTQHCVLFELAAAQAAARCGENRTALDILLDLLDRDSESVCEITPEPKRLVRFDRRIQGEIADWASGASAAEVQPLLRMLATRLDRKLGTGETVSFRRYAALLNLIPLTATFTNWTTKAEHTPNFLTTQLALIEMARHEDMRMSAAAVHELAKQLDERSYRVDAGRQYGRLLNEFGDVPLPGGRTGEQVVEDIPPDALVRAHIDGANDDPWPLIQPVQEVRDEVNFEIYHYPIPVEAEQGSLLDRIDVFADRTGKSVRFQGDGIHGYWEVELPKSSNPFRHQWSMHRGWGIGPLLVLRLGTELFGISPLDEKGEPTARILWSLDTLGNGLASSENWLVVGRQPRIGFGTFSEAYVDGFGRYVAQVGPVCPGFICYHEKGKLVAIDPATGEKLWERFDLPEAAITAGDDRAILLMSELSSRLEVLRPLDGKTVKVRQLNHRPQEDLLRCGRFAVLEENAAAGYRLREVDLADGNTVWEREFPIGSIPFAIDGDTFGVVSPGGYLDVLTVREGRSEWTSRVSRPQMLQQVYCTMDEDRLFLVLSEPFENVSEARINQIRQGYRNPMVNGTLYAFSRKSGALSWQTRLHDSAFALDQPKDAPLLVLSYYKPDPDASNEVDVSKRPVLSMVRCLDKRTGDQIFELAEPSRNDVYHSLESNVDDQWVDLRLPRKTIRLRYGRDEPENAERTPQPAGADKPEVRSDAPPTTKP